MIGEDTVDGGIESYDHFRLRVGASITLCSFGFAVAIEIELLQLAVENVAAERLDTTNWSAAGARFAGEGRAGRWDRRLRAIGEGCDRVGVRGSRGERLVECLARSLQEEICSAERLGLTDRAEQTMATLLPAR